MANLQVRDIDERLYTSLKRVAKAENRSLSQEVIHILEKYLDNPKLFNSNPSREFLELCGSWEDTRTADQIINEIKKSRKNSKRFERSNVLFD